MNRNRVNPEWQRVGATLRQMRELRGVKAAELANAVGVSGPYLCNIEAGRKPLTPPLAVKVAEALMVRPMSLLRSDQFAAVAA